jgi:hypothetical protein
VAKARQRDWRRHHWMERASQPPQRFQLRGPRPAATEFHVQLISPRSSTECAELRARHTQVRFYRIGHDSEQL